MISGQNSFIPKDVPFIASLGFFPGAIALQQH